MICVKCGKEVPNGPFCCQCGAEQSRKRSVRHRGNGSGTAIRRGKTWTAIVSLGSYKDSSGERERLVRVRKTKGGFRTKSEALDYCRTLAESDKKETPTIIDLWNSYETSEFTKLSTSKQTAYRIAKERLKPIWMRKIDALKKDDLQTVVNSSASTYYPARDMKSLLSLLYKSAMADQYVTINLAKFITLPQLDEEEPEPFTTDEVKKMWEAYGNGDTFIGYLLLMIYSGMMPAELMGCKKDMIRWESCEIYGCGRKTKKRKETPIVFAEIVKPVLENICEESNSRIGKILCMNKDNFYKEYHAVLERIGVRDLPPYSCRHTTATDAVKQNVATSVIQQIMRHSRITTTQKYIHVGADEAHAAMNAIQKPDLKNDPQK